jgi:hypothetical protein
MFGDDVDGDAGGVDNQLGTVFAALTSTGDANAHLADMIASGALASSIVIQAPSLANASKAGVSYFGVEGDAATAMGGRIVNGVVVSNRSATTQHPGAATILLPVFDAADPLVLQLELAEIDLTPDGSGGYDAIVRGGIPIDNARMAATTGLGQMIASDPLRHIVFSRFFDSDHDGIVQPDEIANSSVVQAFLVADLHAKQMMSVGFSVHLAPCDSGRCAAVAPADACSDRVIDGDESDVDCGGSCPHKCPAGGVCRSVADCQTAGCDGGRCRAASCTDGVRDGIESDVDCGLITGCKLCALGQTCVNGADCTSGRCSNGAGSPGACMP